MESYRQTRNAKVADRSINLRSEDPVVRLEELCAQGLYKVRYSWDKFRNGVMYTCELYFTVQTQTGAIRNYSVITTSRFVDTRDIGFAQKQVAAIMLDELGLGVVEEQDAEDTENQQRIRELMHKAVNVINTVINDGIADSPNIDDANKPQSSTSWADMVDADERKQSPEQPRTSWANVVSSSSAPDL